MHMLDSVGKYIGRFSVDLRLADRLSLDEDEVASIFPVHSHFGRRQVRTQRRRPSQAYDRRRGGSGIDHRLDDGIGNIGRFQRLQTLNAGIETRGAAPGRARSPDLGEDHIFGDARAHHGNHVLVGETPSYPGIVRAERRLKKEESKHQSRCQ